MSSPISTEPNCAIAFKVPSVTDKINRLLGFFKLFMISRHLTLEATHEDQRKSVAVSILFATFFFFAMPKGWLQLHLETQKWRVRRLHYTIIWAIRRRKQAHEHNKGQLDVYPTVATSPWYQMYISRTFIVIAISSNAISALMFLFCVDPVFCFYFLHTLWMNNKYSFDDI